MRDTEETQVSRTDVLIEIGKMALKAAIGIILMGVCLAALFAIGWVADPLYELVFPTTWPTETIPEQATTYPVQGLGVAVTTGAMIIYGLMIWGYAERKAKGQTLDKDDVEQIRKEKLREQNDDC